MQLPPPPSALTDDSAPATPDIDRTTGDAPEPSPDVDPRAVGQALIGAIDSVLAGHHDIAEIAVATLFSGGHLLIEDIPGVGKTLLAQVVARAVGGSFSRIQGTPDLLPGDVTGSMMPSGDSAGGTELRFRAGPVFSNVVVFDELNRATPRTQSALLEAAEEATVTVDGVAHPLPQPFMFVATQNPIEVAGTYGLGEGSLDRFAAVVSPGRAAPEFELDVLTGRRGRSMLGAIEAITTPGDIVSIRRSVDHVHVSDAIGAYVVELLTATRHHPAVRLGASTRAGVSLISLARARAALHGRSYVVPDDIAVLAATSLGHRVLLADSNGSTTAGRELVAECVASLPAPTP